MNNNERRFITWLGIAGVTVLLSAFVLTLFGIIDLKFADEFCANFYVDIFLKMVLFITNIVFICLIVSNKSKFIFHIIFLTLILYPILMKIPEHLWSLATVLYPLFCAFAIGLMNKIPIKTLAFSSIALSILVILFQQTSNFIKVGNFLISYEDFNTIEILVFSIDLVLFYLYLRKVGDYYAMGKFLVFSKSKSVRQAEEPSEEVLNVEELTKRQEAVFRLLAGGYQIFQLLVVLGIGVINNMWIELVIMLIVFWNGRKILGNCWHSEKLSICSAATFTGFYILTKITPPFSISLFLVICLCGMFTYFMYVLGLKSDRLEYLEESKIVSDSEILKLKQKLEIMNGEFSSYRFSRKMESFAIDWLTNNMSDKELMLKHEINSENTLNSRKRRIKDKMNTI